MPPLVLATTFAQANAGTLSGTELPGSFGKGFEYSRTGNPTRGAWEIAIAAAENAEFGLAYSSGMVSGSPHSVQQPYSNWQAAITACVHLVGHSAHIISSDDVCKSIIPNLYVSHTCCLKTEAPSATSARCAPLR